MAHARGRHLTHLRRTEVLHRSLSHTGYGSGTGAAPYTPAKGRGTAQVTKAHRVWLMHGVGTLHTREVRRYCTGRLDTQIMAHARGRHLTHLQTGKVLQSSLRHTGYGSGMVAAPYTPAKGGDTALVAQVHRVWLWHGGSTLHTCEVRRYCTGR